MVSWLNKLLKWKYSGFPVGTRSRGWDSLDPFLLRPRYLHNCLYMLGDWEWKETENARLRSTDGCFDKIGGYRHLTGTVHLFSSLRSRSKCLSWTPFESWLLGREKLSRIQVGKLEHTKEIVLLLNILHKVRGYEAMMSKDRQVWCVSFSSCHLPDL